MSNILAKERSKAIDIITKLADRDELRFLSIGNLKELIDKKD